MYNMSSKQVTLDKKDYDAMENELADLRIIVESRTVVKIVEPQLNWHLAYAAADGTQIKYVLGTDGDVAIPELAAQVNYYVNELQHSEAKVRTCNRELITKTDEINRLNKLTWYDKLLGKK